MEEIFPSLDNVSRLAPNFHFGEISPNKVWYTVVNNNENTDHFLSELDGESFQIIFLPLS